MVKTYPNGSQRCRKGPNGAQAEWPGKCESVVPPVNIVQLMLRFFGVFLRTRLGSDIPNVNAFVVRYNI